MCNILICYFNDQAQCGNIYNIITIYTVLNHTYGIWPYIWYMADYMVLKVAIYMDMAISRKMPIWSTSDKMHFEMQIEIDC